MKNFMEDCGREREAKMGCWVGKLMGVGLRSEKIQKSKARKQKETN
jgi:hypothetical protein